MLLYPSTNFKMPKAIYRYSRNTTDIQVTKNKHITIHQKLCDITAGALTVTPSSDLL